MDLVLYGFYKLKDKYFTDFPSPGNRYMDNKSGNRPYYLAINDTNGIIWLLPISSKVEKYKAKIAADEEKYGECITCHIIRFMSEERAVLIGNMIPVIPEYIKGKFTIGPHHYVVQDTAAIKAIKKRASRYLTLVRSKKMHPVVDILATERILINRQKNYPYYLN